MGHRRIRHESRVHVNGNVHTQTVDEVRQPQEQHPWHPPLRLFAYGQALSTCAGLARVARSSGWRWSRAGGRDVILRDQQRDPPGRVRTSVV